MMSTSMSFLDNTSTNSEVYATSYVSSSTSNRAHMAGPAFESAVASYASRVLKKKSPPESNVDASVGPYVTSTLRSALQSADLSDNFPTGSDVYVLETLPDYDEIMELLEEHCSLSEEVAKSVLKSIIRALLTGVFDDDENRSTFGSMGSTNGFSASNAFSGGHGGKYRSLSMGSENDYRGYGGGRFRSFSLGTYDDLGRIGANSSASSFGDLLNNTELEHNRGYAQASMIEEEPSFLFEEDEVPPESKVQQENIFSESFDGNSGTEEKMNGIFLQQSATPLKPDKLIPEDLLGFIDDNCSFSHDEQKGQTSKESEEITNSLQLAAPSSEVDKMPPDTSTAAKEQEASTNYEEIPSRIGNKKKKTKVKDMDLAASLFTRPRSRSLHDIEKSPKLKPMAPPTSAIGLSGLNNASASAIMNNSIPALFQKQLDSAVQILMAMNYDVCEEAAYESALVSNADVNVAQHVIDGALSAPPVCRHMFNSGCYRSDCQFSHDIDGHTCIFWLRGRCGKGETCKFMHGFSEKLLDGVDVEFLNAQSSSRSNHCAPVQSSSGAVNAIKTTNLVQHNMMTPFALPLSASNNTKNHIQPEAQQGIISAEKRKTLPNEVENRRETLLPQSSPTPTFSFAKIASKGYSEKSSFGLSEICTSNVTHNENKTIRIPQDLWSPYYNRSSNAFHISDPIARYKEVSTTTVREDVIDLHFQSIKSFPVVLSAILPEKLRDHQEVWIVSGTGHHVSSNTHQKSGGVLENAVIGWLTTNNYNFLKGRDKNGFGGACLVKGRNR